MRLPVPHVVVQWHIATVHHCLTQHVVVVPGPVGLAKQDSLYVDIDQQYLKGRIFTKKLLYWLFSMQLFLLLPIFTLNSPVLFLLVHNMIS